MALKKKAPDKRKRRKRYFRIWASTYRLTYCSQSAIRQVQGMHFVEYTSFFSPSSPPRRWAALVEGLQAGKSTRIKRKTGNRKDNDESGENSNLQKPRQPDTRLGCGSPMLCEGARSRDLGLISTMSSVVRRYWYEKYGRYSERRSGYVCLSWGCEFITSQISAV